MKNLKKIEKLICNDNLNTFEFFNCIKEINIFLGKNINKSKKEINEELNKKNFEVYLIYDQLKQKKWFEKNSENDDAINFLELIKKMEKNPYLYLENSIKINSCFEQKLDKYINYFKEKDSLIINMIGEKIENYDKLNTLNFPFYFHKILDKTTLEKKIKKIYNFAYKDKLIAFNNQKNKNKEYYIDFWYFYINLLISNYTNIIKYDLYAFTYNFIFEEKGNKLYDLFEFEKFFLKKDKKYAKNEIVEKLLKIIEKNVQEIFINKKINIKLIVNNEVSTKELKKLLKVKEIYNFIPRSYGIILNYVFYDNNGWGLRNKIAHENESFDNKNIDFKKLYFLLFLAKDIKILKNLNNN